MKIISANVLNCQKILRAIEICSRTSFVKIFEKFSNLGSSSVTRRISVHISGTFSIKNGERVAEERSPGFRYRSNDKHSDYLFYVASSLTLSLKIRCIPTDIQLVCSNTDATGTRLGTIVYSKGYLRVCTLISVVIRPQIDLRVYMRAWSAS